MPCGLEHEARGGDRATRYEHPRRRELAAIRAIHARVTADRHRMPRTSEAIDVDAAPVGNTAPLHQRVEGMGGVVDRPVGTAVQAQTAVPAALRVAREGIHGQAGGAEGESGRPEVERMTTHMAQE